MAAATILEFWKYKSFTAGRIKSVKFGCDQSNLELTLSTVSCDKVGRQVINYTARTCACVYTTRHLVECHKNISHTARYTHY